MIKGLLVGQPETHGGLQVLTAGFASFALPPPLQVFPRPRTR